MKPYTEKSYNNLESKIQEGIKKFLEYHGWYVREMHASMIHAGWPDLYVTHVKHNARWIEVKRPKMKGSKFTPAQLEVFPLLHNNGSPVWILTSNSYSEYAKLFRPGNWEEYLFKTI